MEVSELTIETIRPDVDWTDDDRVGSLFGPFRRRDLNVASWDAKMIFWKEVILEYLTRRESPAFTVEEMERALLRNFERKCHCLSDVVNEMKSEGLIVELSSLRASWDMSHSTWGWWTLKMAGKGARSLIGKVWSHEVHPQKVTFVHKRVLDEASASALKRLSNADGFRLEGAVYIQVGDGELDLNASNLVHKRLCWPVEVGGLKFLKVGPRPPKDEDLGVLTLWKLGRDLERQVGDMEAQEVRLRAQAKGQLASGGRTAAASTVRRMKRNRNALEQKLAVSDNVSELLAKIETSTDHSKVIETFRLGLRSLKAVTGQSTAEEAEAVLDEMTECVDRVNELSEAISSSSCFPLDGSVSEADLEEELQNILRENDDDDDRDLLGRLDKLAIPSDDKDVDKLREKVALPPSMT